MSDIRTLQVTTPSDREIAMTRSFDAPRRLVWDAHTKPQLVRQWLFGPDGWSMPVCEIDLRVGGRFRYVWRNDADGSEMGMSGEFREVVPPERLVHVERFDQAWYEGDAIVTTSFAEEGGRTTVTMTLLMSSKEARDVVIKSEMASGMAFTYDRLEKLLAGGAASAGEPA